jgi:hypothetical protein
MSTPWPTARLWSRIVLRDQFLFVVPQLRIISATLDTAFPVGNARPDSSTIVTIFCNEIHSTVASVSASFL